MPMTTRKSSKSSSARKSASRRPIARPFAAELLNAARQVADAYRLILEPDAKRGFLGRALEFPTVFERGATPDECVHNARQALTVAVATMLEMGQQPPAATSTIRQEQVNIRLSADEKLLLETRARNAGFRGLSDYARAALLRPLGAAAPRQPRRSPHRSAKRKRVV